MSRTERKRTQRKAYSAKKVVRHSPDLPDRRRRPCWYDKVVNNELNFNDK